MKNVSFGFSVAFAVISLLSYETASALPPIGGAARVVQHRNGSLVQSASQKAAQDQINAIRAGKSATGKGVIKSSIPPARK